MEAREATYKSESN
jgi:chromosome segregation ATPase